MKVEQKLRKTLKKIECKVREKKSKREVKNKLTGPIKVKRLCFLK